MKKTIFTALVLGVTAVSAHVISLPDVSQEMMDALVKGNAPGTVIELPQGTTLPMNIFVKGDFFTLSLVDGTPYQITIEKTIFVKLEKDNFFFSTDLEEWKSMEAFFSGSFGVALGMVEGVQQLSFFGELNERRAATASLIYSTE